MNSRSMRCCNNSSYISGASISRSMICVIRARETRPRRANSPMDFTSTESSMRWNLCARASRSAAAEVQVPLDAASATERGAQALAELVGLDSHLELDPVWWTPISNSRGERSERAT